MHKTFGKKIAGGLMAAAMAVSAATAVIAPMGAFAGDQLGQSTFDEGIGLPWHTCETNPAKQSFNIKDGTYNVTIVNNDGPESRWDLQLRHRGLKIESGHTYKIHWEVEASTAGQMYTKLGDYGGKNEVWHNNMSDGGKGFNETWDCVQIQAGKNSFDATFTADKTVEVAEWAFHYGGKGEHQSVDCFPNDTVLKFDNLTLEDTTSDANDFDKTNEFGVIRPKSNVRLNQIGYYPNLAKKASYVTDASQPLDFEIRDASGNAVYTGKTTVFGEDSDSGTSETQQVTVGDEELTKYKDTGANVHIIDFSDFTTPGVYTIFVKDTTGISGTQSGLKEGAYDTTIDGDKVMWHNWVTDIDYVMNASHEFRIDENIYDDGLVKNSLNYFYQNRSGVPIESQYITSGDASTLSHSEYGHNPDTAYVQSKWVKAYAGDFSDGDKTYSIDVTGGWYDAGDHGKYVVNGGVSVWTLQNAYEISKKNGNDAKWTDGTIAIPENKDSAPDILDEARVELEFMLKMMVKSNDPYWGKYEGMVYHKMHDHKWTGLAIHAWKYEGFDGCVRIVKPPTLAATYNLAATAAQAARLWKGIDDAFADECLAAAKKAYDAANKNFYAYSDAEATNVKSLYAPMDQAIGGGAYGDTYVEDDKYWAACELYSTTGDDTYYNDLKSYSNTADKSGNDKAFSLTYNLGGGENNGSFGSFNWGCTAGLGTLSLYLSDNTSAEDKAKIDESITKVADEYIKQMNSQGMGIPYKQTTFTDGVNIGKDKNGKLIEITGYEWGSNSFVINNAIVMAYAYDSTKDIKYMNGAAEALDYIFGRNGLDFSYVSGYGTTSLTYPHHRFWAHGVDANFPLAPAGVLSGGPGAGMQDPYIGGLGYQRGTLANQKCYVDNAEAWSVNEVTINWNSPLVWMSTFMLDEAAKADGSTDPTKPTQPTTGDGKVTLWGDTNVDGEVTIADAVLIMQSLANADEYTITAQGQLNGDVVDNGGGITTVDALGIQSYIADIITADQFPISSSELG